MIGINLKIIYIINGVSYSTVTLSKEQLKQIKQNTDLTAFSAYRANLLETYGEDLEGKICINTDVFPYKFTAADKYDRPLTKELKKIWYPLYVP